MRQIRLYYTLKPLIPRALQLGLRRLLVRRKWKRVADEWPILPDAGGRPAGWPGWPGGKAFALVLTHDVEAERGLRKCRDLMRMEEELGFRSCFNFVAEDYQVPPELRQELAHKGFEVGIHGLHHDGLLFSSRRKFVGHARRINRYLEEWGSVGFRAPSMVKNLEWIHDLNIAYDSSTFDTDPFEPQPDSVRTIFPFTVHRAGRSYVELPYTLPQDFTLFSLLGQKDISLWKRKAAWVRDCGGMLLLDTHPDYMIFGRQPGKGDEYPCALYRDFLVHLRDAYEGSFWPALPRDVAAFWREWEGSRQDARPRETQSLPRAAAHS